MFAEIRATISTIGATAGNIVAIIIAIHTARNSPAFRPIVGLFECCPCEPRPSTNTHEATVRTSSPTRIPARARDIGVALTCRHGESFACSWGWSCSCVGACDAGPDDNDVLMPSCPRRRSS